MVPGKKRSLLLAVADGVGVRSGVAAVKSDRASGISKVFVCLRPSLPEATACLAAFHDVLRRHARSGLVVAGLARHSHGLHLTIAIPVPPGPDGMRKAHHVSEDVFTHLIGYRPHYTGAPSIAEVQAVKRLPTRVSAQRASLPIQAWLDAAHYIDI